MNEYNKKVFAKNLNKYMSENGKKQTDIRNLLKVSKSTVSSWCNGTKMPRMDKIEILAQYFGILKSDLIEDKSNSVNNNISEKKAAFINKVISLDENTLDRYIQVLDLIDKED